jgi:cellulose synthase/poly-beta-1,6-N-acetylglucosamine synthase-like glycosyltransferase
MAFETSEIVALTLGLSLFCVLPISYFLSNSPVSLPKNFFRRQSNQNVKTKLFFLQKWLFISFIVLLNALGCVLVYYTRNLQIMLFLILVLKSKDLVMALMFAFNMMYRYFFRYKNYYLYPEPVVSDTPTNVLSFVPVYKESSEQVSKTLKSVLSSRFGSGNHMAFVVSDGENDYFDLLDNEGRKEKNFVYSSWKGNQVRLRVCYGFMYGHPVIMCSKSQNVGKKDSVILLHDIFNYPRSNLPSLNQEMKHEINKDIKSLFGISGFNYIFSTDGDTTVEEQSISLLIDTMNERGAMAVSCVVNADNSSGNFFWNRLQNFQYLYGQYVRRTNEDLLNQVLCLPGCGNMVRIHPLFGKTVEYYSSLPNENNLLETTVQFVGTDRRFTSSLVYNTNGNILQDTRSRVYTLPPQNFSRFLSQRQRWNHNMYFNSLLNIFGKNVNLLSRFFNVIDVLRMSLIYFRLFNTVFFIYLLSAYYSYENVLQLVPYIVLLSYPVVFFVVYSLFDSFLRKQFFYLLLFIVPNKLFTMFTNVLIFSVMMFNIGYFEW